MKKRVKSFKVEDTFNGSIILVYGELWEDGYVDGMVIRRAKFSRDGRKMMDESTSSEEILFNKPYTRTRCFNMGWAICSCEDKYDLRTGIELCKKRFRKSPLKTETGLFLTKDMIQALLLNEVSFIKKNWQKFAPKSFSATREEMKESVNKVNEVNACVSMKKSENEKDEVTSGSYACVSQNDNRKWTKTVGYVVSTDEENVYLGWVIQFGNNNGTKFTSLNYHDGVELISFRKDSVRKATEEEVIDALKNMAENTDFRCDRSTGKLSFLPF